MFSELLLDDPLQQVLAELCYTDMTEVQETAIPLALEGRDIIVNARTGSGKTLAYCLPMIQQILDNPRPPEHRTQALVLAPTRELCRQINKQISLLAKYTGITSTVIIGGEDPRYQKQALLKRPDIVIATPGRLLQHEQRDVIDLDDITILVLDEADRMLELGFDEDVITIAAGCNHECQTSLFSASFNERRFSELTDAVMHEPVLILVDQAREANASILQQKILVDNIAHKTEICAYIIQNEAFQRGIIFANKRDTVEKLASQLQSKGIMTASLHGELDQEVRNRILSRLRNDEIKVIVATDVASRGLDISGLELVINFDIPRSGDDYIHRIGRTGRMDTPGRAINLITVGDWNRMISIERYLGVACELIQVPSLPAKNRAPENLKSSGKTWGDKKPGAKPAAKKKKSKIRDRDRKNIGKRRKASGTNRQP